VFVVEKYKLCIPSVDKNSKYNTGLIRYRF